ncbi:MAG TPA: type IV toxin-antitoxin system AbiEi family antitoxin domain-containing protein [Solirubrobacterales bacterium]|nr:type IV toxin-antitoxin system AbiEi family antitoxin domain-containing protein [Solirubrobacterales bacterium]
MQRKRNPATKDARVAAVATRQKGVIDLEQLRDAGVSPRAASRRAARGSAHRLYRGVYAVGHEAIGEEGRLLAAVMACGPGAMLSHLSAAALWRLRKPMPEVVDVLVPCETGRKIDGLRARRCRYPHLDEITELSGIPCTTPARTLVDCAGVVGRRPLRRMIEQAAVLRLLEVNAVDLALARAKRRRGIRTLMALLAPWRTEDGSLPLLRSLLESRLLPALIEVGLPRPRCNTRMVVGGEPVEIDMLWEDRCVVVEADGEETHGTSAAFHADRRRDQLLVAAGYRIVHVTWRHLEDELSATVGRVAQVLRG